MIGVHISKQPAHSLRLSGISRVCARSVQTRSRHRRPTQHSFSVTKGGIPRSHWGASDRLASALSEELTIYAWRDTLQNIFQPRKRHLLSEWGVVVCGASSTLPTPQLSQQRHTPPLAISRGTVRDVWVGYIKRYASKSCSRG